MNFQKFFNWTSLFSTFIYAYSWKWIKYKLSKFEFTTIVWTNWYLKQSIQVIFSVKTEQE